MPESNCPVKKCDDNADTMMHSVGSRRQDAEKNILHGQWTDYLHHSLSQYKVGARKQSPNTRLQTDKLPAENIDARKFLCQLQRAERLYDG
jgi:cytochrome c553